MSSFPLTITQRFSVVRVITVNVEGENLLQAVCHQSDDCAPSFEDPGWVDDWELRDEDVAPLNPTPGWDDEDYDPSENEWEPE
jgi:hypothetical protein